MSCFEDYEVLEILDTHLNATYFKARNKLTSKICLWKAINYENKCDKSDLIEMLETRKVSQNTYLLDFYDYIHHEETTTIYLITEYCKFGSIYKLLQTCLKNNKYLDEDFIWCTIYKLACFFKITQNAEINLHDVFIDASFNVKLLNFNIHGNTKDLNSLEILLNKMIYMDAINKFPDYYSHELKDLLNFFTDHDAIDPILCHPTMLLKLSTFKKTEIFIQNLKPKDPGIKENESLYQTKLESLRNREANVKLMEQKCREIKQNLDRREKKVALMERLAKEKVARAEIYLKRSREQKSINNKGRDTIEKIDTSFSADCGESIIVTTSRKLNVQDIVKPSKFTKVMSDRRVRFKSHSPLKEMHNFKRELNRQRQIIESKPELQSDSDKTSESNSEKSIAEKTKKKFLSSMFSKKTKKIPDSSSESTHTYEEVDEVECKPINWTEESKKQAFDLLRIMNEESNVEQIKHTYL